MHSKIIMPKKALISVTNKDDIGILGGFLEEKGCEVISTGGTADALTKSDISVTQVSDYTGFPEIFGGRVKTMTPKITGGILYRRGIDDEQAKKNDIEPIDLVAVNLYRFAEAVEKRKPVKEIIENIDIGGPTLIRSAAKSFADVTVIVDPLDYFTVIGMITALGGISIEMRQHLAEKAFPITADYDAQIAGWFAENREEITAAMLQS